MKPSIHNDIRMIAFAYYSTPSDVSGVTTWLVQLAVWLKAQGYPVMFHLQHFGGDIRDSGFGRRLSRHGIPYEIVHRSIYTEENVRNVLSFLNRYQPRVFLPQCIHAFYYAGMVGGRRGLPWVYTMHADGAYYWSMAEVLASERAGGRVVCVSEHLRRELRRRRLAEQPLTIPCGVSLPDRTARYRDRPFRIVYSGRVVEYQKRIGLVVETMLTACQGCPDLECIVIGDGDGLAEARRQVSQSPVRDQIRFTGRLSPEQVWEQLAEAQALLLMSDYEGMPVAVLEAMAAGVVPVVRRSESGLPEIIREDRSGCWVSDDPAEAARELQRLSREPARWERLSQGARKQVAQGYGMEPNFRKWKSLLDELLRDSSPRYPLPTDGDWQLPPVPEGLERIDTRLPPPEKGTFKRLTSHLFRLRDRLAAKRNQQ
ncbi:MAG: hypothetical protein RLY31_824 [Bacteroidota bacterium]|jgi:glycosyltransferase involved in cell wall biosynthesis